jgi:nitrogen regulatory protein P-II 1
VKRYRGARYSTDWSPRIKVELLAQDDYAEYLVDVIRAAAHNRRGVDGNIFIMAVHERRAHPHGSTRA